MITRMPTSAVQVPLKYPTALIFLDESAVKASAGRFFVVGALKVRKPGQLMRAVRDIRDRHGFDDEFKFSRISRAKLPIFCELIDEIEKSDAHIAACVDSACNDGVQLADLVAGAVAHQRGHEGGTTSATSHKGKVAARLAAAFGLTSFAEDVRNSRVNVATHGARVSGTRIRVKASAGLS